MSPQGKVYLTTTTLYFVVLSTLLLGGLILVFEGFNLQYYGRFGPGPGFFPVWLGGMLTTLSAIGLLQVALRSKPAARTPAFDSPKAFWRVFAALFSLTCLAAFIGVIGFRLAVLLYVLSVPRIIARLPLVVIVPVALLASFGAAYVFEVWLLVRLPRATIPFLSNLGL